MSIENSEMVRQEEIHVLFISNALFFFFFFFFFFLFFFIIFLLLNELSLKCRLIVAYYLQT